MTDMGDLSRVLEVQITRDSRAGPLTITQEDYTRGLLMIKRLSAAPITWARLHANRYDISHAVNQLAVAMSKLSKVHIGAVEHVLRYPVGTAD